MKKIAVLIEARPFCVFDATAMQQLEKGPVDIIDMRGSGIDDPKFVQALNDIDIVLCGNDLVVNDAFFDLAPNLKAVAKMGAGLDTVDVKAASKRDVMVFHTPGVNNQAVADHTLGMILCLARKMIYCDRSLREKRWEHTTIMGFELWEKTMGIIGLGAIGRFVALRAKGFNMRIIAHDPYWPEEFAAQHGIESMEIDDLLKEADIVSLHMPLTKESKNLIDKRALEMMKPTAFLINAARGGIVNEADLYEALKSGEIAGAGLDVFEKEPPVDSPLMALDNVLVTPHTAAFTTEAMNNMNISITEQILAFAEGNTPKHIVKV